MEWKEPMPGVGPEERLGSLGLGGGGGRGELVDGQRGQLGPMTSQACLLEGCWEHVNKPLIRAIVFIPFSSHLNGLFPSQRTFFISGGGKEGVGGGRVGGGDTERLEI